jgi:hypothetical protein
MANSPQDRNSVIDIDLSKGIDADSLEKEGMSWAQNIEYRVNRIEVRGGFGTLAQFGTTLNSGRTTGTYGYGAPVGGTLQVTNQGHAQILSVHPLVAYSGTYQGQVLDHLYAFSVYDITTGRRAEHVFRTQTQWMTNLPAAVLRSEAQPAWMSAPTNSTPSFAQLADLQYMCLPGQGVWMYRPIDPYAIDQRLQTVPGTIQNGDDAWFEQVIPVDGVFTDAGATYFSQSSFPLPAAMCAFQNRMVYASGRKLYFSDPDRPDNIQANSFYQVPTERPITAIAVVKGVVLVFTADETWMYQPSDSNQTGLISGGNIYNLSRSIGCLTAQSLTLMGDTAVFMDRRGVYVCDGGTSIQKISGSIDTWFALPEQIQNPLSNFLTQLGLNTLTNQQPRAFIDMQSQLYRSTMTWDPLNQLLYVTFDDLTLVFCPDFGWSVYLYETTALVDSGVPQVGVQQRVINPILFAHAGDLYMIGGADIEEYGLFSDSSVYILKAGRGGSLDRSSVTQEDLRQPYQNWQRSASVAATAPQFWVAPPILMPENFYDSSQGVTLSSPTWLVPVYIAQGTTGAAEVSQVDLKLTFDSTKWKPALISAANYAYLVPPNRLGSRTAFADMQVYTGGVPDPDGATIHIAWDGGAVPNTWTAWPNMVVNRGLPQPLVYLLMQRKAGTTATTSVSMNWTVSVAQLKTQVLRPWVQCQVWLCQETGQPSYPQQDLGDNTHAQPVDWALATPLVGDGKAQYKARGAFTVLQSYGKAVDRQVPDWPVAPYASVTTSDYKDFAAQKIDWDSQDPHEDRDKDSVRLRIQTTAADFPSAKVGGNPEVRWSSTSAQGTGTLLIDDAATDTVAGSEGVRGERFRTMLFGCLNANGEDIKIARVRILTRLTGGLRRTGRTRLG